LTLEKTIADLVSNLRKMGRKVGIEESIDAANALRLLSPSDTELLQAAIKATLFKDFETRKGDEDERSKDRRSERIIRYGANDQRIGKGLPYAGSDEQERKEDKDNRDFQFGVYSPYGFESEQKRPNISKSEEKKWTAGVRKFKSSILTLEGHRFERSSEGQIDPRRTMWLELRKAGESPNVFRSAKKISKANVLLLCDVSGSMSDSNSSIVNMCCSFKRAIPKSEIFLFSTKLKKMTYYASKYSPRELALRIPKLDLGFGGGTKIGHCLRQFRKTYGHLLTRKTTVLIFSDGWDIGDISILKGEMMELHRRTSRVIWVNPFLDSRDYSVETLGMKTALEYADAFLSPTDLLAGLVQSRRQP
jgi:uncharacterized protein